MKKLLISLLSLPLALVIAYFIASYATQYASSVAANNPSLEFGGVSGGYAILFLALALLALACVLVNGYIFWSVRAVKAGRWVVATRIVSAIEAVVPALIILYALVELISHRVG